MMLARHHAGISGIPRSLFMRETSVEWFGLFSFPLLPPSAPPRRGQVNKVLYGTELPFASLESRAILALAG
jgi:LPS sulfotransferase NodH